MAETKKLFDQFAPVTPEEWRAKAEVDLKGADLPSRSIAAWTLPTSSKPNHSLVSFLMFAVLATTTTGRFVRTST